MYFLLILLTPKLCETWRSAAGTGGETDQRSMVGALPYCQGESRAHLRRRGFCAEKVISAGQGGNRSAVY